MFRWIFWLLPALAMTSPLLLKAQVVQAPGPQGVPTTQIQDTIYRADGTGAGGELTITWPEFSANGEAVPAGRLNITIGTAGAVSFGLAPNAGAVPAGTYYTVLYHLSDGTVSTEYWSVPAAAVTGIAAIRSQVVPATVAVQSASVTYVTNAISEAVSGFLPLTGGTLTGPLYLSEDPQQAAEAADKHYVDVSVAGVTGASGAQINVAPTAGQTIQQPAGTTLEVNDLQNVLYAQQFQTGAGSNGINNAENQPVCLTGGCLVTADPGYAVADAPAGLFYPACPLHAEDAYQESTCGFPWPLNSRLWDQRGGTDYFAYSNPRRTSLAALTPYSNDDSRSSLGNFGLARAYIYDYDSGQGNAQLVPELHVMNQFAGGHNNNFGTLGGGTKSNLIGTLFETHFFSQGQHFIAQDNGYCTGLGDCMVHPWQMYTSAGISRPSDEGTHWGDKVMKEDPNVFNGPCVSGCTPGSTQLKVTALTGSNGSQGEGRFLIDLTQASAGGETGASVVGGVGTGNHLINTTTIASSIYSFQAAAGSFPVSTGDGTLAADIPAAAGEYGPGTATFQATLTAGSFTAGATMCVADGGSFEIAAVSSVMPAASGSQSITAAFVRPHYSGAFVFQGGMCGQFLSVNADTTLPNTGYSINDTIRRAIPLIGSPDNATAYYWQPDSAFSNYPGNNISAFANRSVGSASASFAGGTVTVTGAFGFTEGGAGNPNGTSQLGNITGRSVIISGAADPNYDGTFTATVLNNTTFTYVPAAAPTSATATGLTVGYCNCTFTLYPGAEVLGVYNDATKQVDGTMTLGANSVAWATGDTLEEPHWHEMNLENSHNFISMYQPVARPWGMDGPSYGGHATGDLRGWNVYNIAPLNQYLGYGGTLTPPAEAFDTEGWWNVGWSLLAAPNEAVMRVGCKPYSTVNGVAVGGCGAWDASYNVLENLANSGGNGTLRFSPLTENYTFGGQTAIVTIGDNVDGTNPGIQLQTTSSQNTHPVLLLSGQNAALTVSGTGASITTPALTIGAGTATAISGSSGRLAEVSGTPVSGDCARFDANGNLTDGGAACGSTVNPTADASSGNLFFAPLATASAGSPYQSSSKIVLEDSIWSSGTVCNIGPNISVVANSTSSGTLSFGTGTNCNGIPYSMSADLTGAFQSVRVPHVVTSNGTAVMGLTATGGASVAWTAGTVHSDSGGSVTVTAAASGVAAGGTLGSVQFGSAWQQAPNCVFSAASASAVGAAYLPPASATGFSLQAAGSIAGGAVMTFTYACQQ